MVELKLYKLFSFPLLPPYADFIALIQGIPWIFFIQNLFKFIKCA